MEAVQANILFTAKGVSVWATHLFQINMSKTSGTSIVSAGIISNTFEELHSQKTGAPPDLQQTGINHLPTITRSPIRSHSTLLHFEGEMGVFVLRHRMPVRLEDSEMLVGSGIDFTARDAQNIAKEKGLPWFEAKSFRGSTVISSRFFKCRVTDFKHLEHTDHRQRKNQAERKLPTETVHAGRHSHASEEGC